MPNSKPINKNALFAKIKNTLKNKNYMKLGSLVYPSLRPSNYIQLNKEGGKRKKTTKRKANHQ
jgi:hypothetical protein